MRRSTPETWDDLLAKHGEVLACFGAATDNYWSSGEKQWADVVAPRLALPESPVVMEWGAGSGRLARAALPHVGQLWAYEPADAVRALLAENLAAAARTSLPDDRPGTVAVVIGPEELPLVLPQTLDALYCIFVMHHMDYDALWEFFGFAQERLKPGGVLVYDYINIESKAGASFLARKDRSEWPIYIWHESQLLSLVERRAPRLQLLQVVVGVRDIHVWKATDETP